MRKPNSKRILKKFLTSLQMSLGTLKGINSSSGKSGRLCRNQQREAFYWMKQSIMGLGFFTLLLFALCNVLSCIDTVNGFVGLEDIWASPKAARVRRSTWNGNHEPAASLDWKTGISIRKVENSRVGLNDFATLPSTGLGFYEPSSGMKKGYGQMAEECVVREDSKEYSGSYGYMELGQVYVVRVLEAVSMVCYTPGKADHHRVTIFHPGRPQMIIRNACNLYQNCYMGKEGDDDDDDDDDVLVSDALPLFYSTEAIENVKNRTVNPSYTTVNGFNEVQRHRKDPHDDSYVQYLMRVRYSPTDGKKTYEIEAFNCFPMSHVLGGLVRTVHEQKGNPILRLEGQIQKSGNITNFNIGIFTFISEHFYFDHHSSERYAYEECEWSKYGLVIYGQDGAIKGTFFSKTGMARWLLHVMSQDIVMHVPSSSLKTLTLEDASYNKLKVVPEAPLRGKPRHLTPSEYSKVCTALYQHYVPYENEFNKKKISPSFALDFGLNAHLVFEQRSLWMTLFKGCFIKPSVELAKSREIPEEDLKVLLKNHEDDPTRPFHRDYKELYDYTVDFDFKCALHAMFNWSGYEHYSDLSAWVPFSPLSHLDVTELIKNVEVWYPGHPLTWFGKVLKKKRDLQRGW